MPQKIYKIGPRSCFHFRLRKINIRLRLKVSCHNLCLFGIQTKSQKGRRYTTWIFVDKYRVYHEFWLNIGNKNDINTFRSLSVIWDSKGSGKIFYIAEVKHNIKPYVSKSVIYTVQRKRERGRKRLCGRD